MQGSKRVDAPKSFISDFELVAAQYDLKALGEYDAARNAARADLSNAITTYAALAEEIRGDK
jgi:hypothetical protein